MIMYMCEFLKHITILFSLSDHIKYRSIIMVGLSYYNQSGATELLIMRDSHYGRMCFKSFKTLEALHS